MDIKLPRLKIDEKIINFPPLFNETMDELETRMNVFNKKIDVSTKKIDDINARLDDFYGRLMEIFGIFIAIFSLILVTGYNLNIAKGENILDTALNALIYLLPLTVVLLIFVLLLNFLRKR